MKNFEKMTNSIYLSKESDCPFLLVGNPGMGKTTVVKKWAEKNGYHLEEIMGSSFSRDEVLGYMVNVNGRLELLEPFWFRRIRELAEKGIKSVLFIDEISTTGSDVQSSLLRLIFDRTIGNGDRLPEGTIIMSAANYKANLPGYCDVSSPTLNRFCLVNIEEDNLETMVDDYVINDIPDVKPVSFGNLTNIAICRKLVGETLKKIFAKFSTADESGSKPLEPLNHNLQIYDAENEKNTQPLYNFISGRNLNALMRVIFSIAQSNIDEVRPMVEAAVEGFIGAGTNSFASETIRDTYILYGVDELEATIAKLRNYVKDKPAYETMTENLVAETTKVAPSSSSPDALFENIRRNVEHNPEEKAQIEADMNELAAALKIRGHNFGKKYASDSLFSSVCNYISSVYDGYVKSNKMDNDLVKYVKYYMNRSVNTAA